MKNCIAEWGIMPTDPQLTDSVVFESVEFTASTERTAKGQAFKDAKACPKVVDVFSTPDEPWQPSEAQWEDWQPTENASDREDWQFTERRSKDRCVEQLNGAPCLLFIRLYTQEATPEPTEADAKD